MAKLVDISETIYLMLSFHSRATVITYYEDDINNWIPIDFELKVANESYKIYPEANPKLCMYEINLMLTKLQSSIDGLKLHGKFKDVEIGTADFYYSLDFRYLYEDQKIECVVWTIEASRTNGEIQHCDRGFRFTVTFDSLISFTNDLKEELQQIILKYGYDVRKILGCTLGAYNE